VSHNELELTGAVVTPRFANAANGSGHTIRSPRCLRFTASGGAHWLCAYWLLDLAPRASMTLRSVSLTEPASGNTFATSGSSTTTVQPPENLSAYFPRTPPLKS